MSSSAGDNFKDDSISKIFVTNNLVILKFANEKVQDDPGGLLRCFDSKCLEYKLVIELTESWLSIAPVAFQVSFFVQAIDKFPIQVLFFLLQLLLFFFTTIALNL